MKFCDLTCESARPPQEAVDGAGSCRSFSGIYCLKLERVVFKSAPCQFEREIEQGRGKGENAIKSCV